MVHNIVFIGASFGALPAAHAVLRDIIPKQDPKTEYKVTIISSSTHLFWKVGSPRTIVNPTSLPIEKVLLEIEPEFKKYPTKQFEFINASAKSIDPSSRVITLGDSSKTVQYDQLIIASGTSFKSAIWAVTDGTKATVDALKDIHARLPDAKTVLVAGGGAAGVETAGELGSLYGKNKDITLLSGSTALLNRLQNKKIGTTAAKKLEGMGVTVVHKNLRVNSSKRVGSQDVLEMSDGTTKTVDVYIEATGDRPNNEFIPKEWLNEKGYVKTDGTTLKLDVPGGSDVYCIGSVASYSDGSIFDVKFAQKALQESIRLDLVAKAGKPDTAPRKIFYKKITSDMQLVPIGPGGGVGVIMGYQVPSLMVWGIKSRDFMIGNAPKLVNGTG